MATITVFDPISGDTIVAPRTLLDPMEDDITAHEHAYGVRAERQTVAGVAEAMLVLDRVGYHWRDA